MSEPGRKEGILHGGVGNHCLLMCGSGPERPPVPRSGVARRSHGQPWRPGVGGEGATSWPCGRKEEWDRFPWGGSPGDRQGVRNDVCGRKGRQPLPDAQANVLNTSRLAPGRGAWCLGQGAGECACPKRGEAGRNCHHLVLFLGDSFGEGLGLCGEWIVSRGLREMSAFPVPPPRRTLKVRVRHTRMCACSDAGAALPFSDSSPRGVPS